MRNLLVLLALIAFSSQAFGNNKVIYAKDDRVELQDFSNFLFQQLARSTAAQIPNASLELNKDGDVFEAKNVQTLGETLRLCEGEAFAEQPFLSSCSGFLVADDILLTAGHCYSGFMENACEEFSWVFDYKVDEGGQPTLSFPKENVFKCKEVLKVVLDMQDTKLDYAIIRLDRPVVDRMPLPLRTEGSVDEASNLTVIGYPWGLPAKIASNATVLKNTEAGFFSASLDTFQGNSGSAVFNEQGTVEGILVRGKTDAVPHFEPGVGVCRKLNQCDQDGSNCSVDDPDQPGEDVTRITSVLEDLNPYLQP